MEKNKKIKIGIGCAAVAVAAAAVIFLSGGKSKQSGPAMEMGRAAAETVVKAQKPEIGDISLSTGLTGTVEPSDVVYVYAKAAGDVTAVLVKAGDMVVQGQILCEIDTEQVESAQNAMESAKVSLTEAQSNLNRMQILYAGGDLSEQEYEQYVNKVKSSRLQYESAKLAYDRQVEYSTVTAPIGGRIESCDIEVHDRVSQSSQLCVIAGEGEKRVSFYVTERMMANISPGDKLNIQKDGSSYEAFISEISSMVDSETGLFKVKAELQDAQGIATGSTVKLNLVTERTENAMTVPVDAVYYSGGKGYVFLYKDGVIEKADVEVGLYDSEQAEILDGISMEDMVVSTWSSNLYQGARARLYGEEAENRAQDMENGKQKAEGPGGDRDASGPDGSGPEARGAENPEQAVAEDKAGGATETSVEGNSGEAEESQTGSQDRDNGGAAENGSAGQKAE